ncbi:MAG: hypothetical protein E7240_00350 [Lachnospiraceae bacterium]|nr:hypothetical protein [Lachnospiraceae bacterium]
MKNNTDMEEKRREKKEKRGANGLITQIILSLISIGVGALLLFVPGTKTLQLCYIFCGGLAAAGVVLIARFFITKAFNRLHDYSFSMGILFLILGICGLLRIDVIDSHFQLTCGFLLLVLGVMILQGMVQLNVVDNLMWILLMLFTTAALVASVILILDIQAVIGLVPGLLYWLLLCVGGASILSLLIVALALFLHRRKLRKMEEEGYSEEDEDAEDYPAEQDAGYEPVPEEIHNPVQETPSAGYEQLAGFAQQESAPTGETQIYPPIAGGSAAEPAAAAEAAAEPVQSAAVPVENNIESVKQLVDTADLPDIVPPESL